MMLRAVQGQALRFQELPAHATPWLKAEIFFVNKEQKMSRTLRHPLTHFSRRWRHGLPALAAVWLAIGQSAPALAENVTYPGVTLQTLTDGAYTTANALAPSLATPDANGNDKTTSTANNTVTRNASAADPDPDYVFGAFNGQSSLVENNQVFLTGGTVAKDVIGGYNFLNQGDTAANGNSVTLSGGIVGHSVFGGYVYSLTDGNATASGNSVEISNDAVFHDVYGGAAYVNLGGVSNASGNTVTVHGGQMLGGQLAGANAGIETDSNASGNTVDIQGGEFTAQFIAGAWVMLNYPFSPNAIATTMNNTVKISGSPVFTAVDALYGGYQTDVNAGHSISSGNTLKMESAGLAVKQLNFFEKFDFTLPAGLNTPVLTVTQLANLGAGAVVTVSAAPGLNVNTGDVFTLIDASAGTLNGTVAAAPNCAIGGHTCTIEIEGGAGAPGKLLFKIGAPVSLASTAVPTLNEWALALLALLLTGVALRRRA